MSKTFDEYISDKPEINIISKEELSLLKIKLGKSHRKGSDWTIIKDLLISHDVITVNIQKPIGELKSVHGILCEENKLMIFTNINDCEKHIQHLHATSSISRFVNIVALPFELVIDISEKTNMPILIDMTDKKNQRLIVYYPHSKELKAVILSAMC